MPDASSSMLPDKYNQNGLRPQGRTASVRPESHHNSCQTPLNPLTNRTQSRSPKHAGDKQTPKTPPPPHPKKKKPTSERSLSPHPPPPDRNPSRRRADLVEHPVLPGRRLDAAAHQKPLFLGGGRGRVSRGGREEVEGFGVLELRVKAFGFRV